MKLTIDLGKLIEEHVCVLLRYDTCMSDKWICWRPWRIRQTLFSRS